MKKAIFGGTFDPIHNGHIYIAYEALKCLELDKVIFMPSGNPPHKQGKNITDAFLRAEMIKMVIKNEEKFEISGYEINKTSINYTYETMEYYKQLEPNTQWYFLTGTDCLMELESWKNVDRILNACKFVVFSRAGYYSQDIINQKKYIENKYNNSILYLNLKAVNISSTKVRNMIKNGIKASRYLPSNVYNTIKVLGLYL